jgi:hypothetical protein
LWQPIVSGIQAIGLFGKIFRNVTGLGIGPFGVSTVGPGGTKVYLLLAAGLAVPAWPAAIAAVVQTALELKQRGVTDEEYAFANRVFRNTLPPQDSLTLTNLVAPNGKSAFTIPSFDGSIMVNVGDECYQSPTTAALAGTRYTTPGQLFIHELTHAWQIAHSSLVPGLACKRILNSDYDYGGPDVPFGCYGVEQQAQIVDDWFGGTRSSIGHPGNTGRENPADPFFHYISDNIWLGDPGPPCGLIPW